MSHLTVAEEFQETYEEKRAPIVQEWHSAVEETCGCGRLLDSEDGLTAVHENEGGVDDGYQITLTFKFLESS